MKQLILILIALSGSLVYAQTDSIEKKVLLNTYLEKKITVEEFSKLGAKWNSLINSGNTYPHLDFDKNGKIEYCYLENFPQLSKNTIFSHVSEWLAINYGLSQANTYTSLADGKIICTLGMNVVENVRCNYTLIFTIRDEKALIEFVKLDYESTFNGYYTSEGNWVPDKTLTNNLETIFPIIMKKPTEWNYYFSILYNIDNNFRDAVLGLRSYITDYNQNYQL